MALIFCGVIGASTEKLNPTGSFVVGRFFRSNLCLKGRQDLPMRDSMIAKVESLVENAVTTVFETMLNMQMTGVPLSECSFGDAPQIAGAVGFTGSLSGVIYLYTTTRFARRITCGLLGLSEETTCYLSATSFDAPGRFEDFVVHEAAHIFHNCKRETIGLPETRTREWLLEIDYGKRETFAYACEAYSRLHSLGDSPRGRQELLAEHERGSMPPDERVDAVEYLDILREAVTARNGWKRILQRCSPPRVARRARMKAA